MHIADALKNAKEGKTVLARIHGDECRLTFTQREAGCGMYHIHYHKHGRNVKDIFLSEHYAEAEWFEQLPEKGLTLSELAKEIDDQA